jgi:DMSO/TMAO reductase YedYZ molybdopterin-dependent catalytic subunit
MSSDLPSSLREARTSRRSFALGAFATLGGISVAARAQKVHQVDLPFANGERALAAYPQKRPLILQSARPPQLETPFAVFDQGLITPNDAFFVRYHMSGLPTDFDLADYRLTLSGLVEHPLSLSLAELKRDFPATEIVAVNQCSGNSRGFVTPRVAGGQLGNGAMGNARWRGVSLRALLERAGVKPGARQLSFNGLDTPASPATPDFVKALDLDHAMSGDVMLAYAMNGAALPFLNGFPLRLVVPGYYGTYWVKHLNAIEVLDHSFDGYWMAKAYRVPDNDCACVPAGTRPDKTRPIGRLNIRSFLTSHADGARVRAGPPVALRGIAFDGGTGIAKVEVSIDGGTSWRQARLGEDIGRYSFREWRIDVPIAIGTQQLLVRATSNGGETQPLDPSWNPSGYRRNVVERTTLQGVA